MGLRAGLVLALVLSAVAVVTVQASDSRRDEVVNILKATALAAENDRASHNREKTALDMAELEVSKELQGYKEAVKAEREAALQKARAVTGADTASSTPGKVVGVPEVKEEKPVETTKAKPEVLKATALAAENDRASHNREKTVLDVAELEVSKELQGYKEAVKAEREAAPEKASAGRGADTASSNPGATNSAVAGVTYTPGGTSVGTLGKVVGVPEVKEEKPVKMTKGSGRARFVLKGPTQVIVIFYGATSTSWSESDKDVVRKLIKGVPDVMLKKVNSVRNWFNLARLYKDDAGMHVSEMMDIQEEVVMTSALNDLSRKEIDSIIYGLIYTRKEIPYNPNAVYAFLTASDVRVSNGDGKCSWHYPGVVFFLWAGMPGPGSTCGPQIPEGFTYPGGKASAVLASEFARQLVETVTDPFATDAEGSTCKVYTVDQSAEDKVAFTHTTSDGSKFILPQIRNPVTGQCSSELAVAVCGDAAYGLPCDLLSGNPDKVPETTPEAKPTPVQATKVADLNYDSGSSTTKVTGPPKIISSISVTNPETTAASKDAYGALYTYGSAKPTPQAEAVLDAIKSTPVVDTNKGPVDLSTKVPVVNAPVVTPTDVPTVEDLVIGVPLVEPAVVPEKKADPATNKPTDAIYSAVGKPLMERFPEKSDPLEVEVLGNPLVVDPAKKLDKMPDPSSSSVLGVAALNVGEWKDAVEKPEATLESQGKQGDLVVAEKGVVDMPTAGATTKPAGGENELPAVDVQLAETYSGQEANRDWASKFQG